MDIAPWYPVQLMDYGSRKTESEEVVSRLKAKALAVRRGRGGAGRAGRRR